MLRNRTAIITGSTSGIGLGIAGELAAAGAGVLLNGFGDAGDIARLGSDLATRHGVKVRHHPADMSKPGEIADMVAFAAREFGSVDILVNNAGIQHVAPVDSFPAAQWDRIIAINLSAVFHATAAALPLMRARGWGRVINVASVHGLVASVEKSAYVAAKHGVVGLTKVTALEAAGSGVTCVAICPGWVLTPLVQKQIDERARRDGVDEAEARVALLSEKQPSKDFVTPAQLGALAVFLCSPAADQITGVALPVDGGWTAQ